MFHSWKASLQTVVLDTGEQALPRYYVENVLLDWH